MKKILLSTLLYFTPIFWCVTTVMLSAVEVSAQDQHLLDSLEQQLKYHNNRKLELGKNVPALYDTFEVNILNSICNIWLDYNIDKANNYASQMLKISEAIGYKKGMAKAYNSLGQVLQAKSDYEEAIRANKKSLEINNEIEDKRGAAASYNNIGNIYLVQDNYPEALKYYFNALRINEQIGNREWQAFNLCNISSIYEKQLNYPAAMEKIVAAGKLVDPTGTMFLYPTYFVAIGSIYEKQGNDKEALINYTKYLEGCRKLGFLEGEAITNNYIGRIYQKQGNYEKALQLFFSALKIFEKNGTNLDLDLTETYFNIGSVHAKLNNYNNAVTYLNKSLSIAKDINSLAFIEKGYESLSVLEKSKENFANALKYYKLSVVYHDSILNTESIKKTAALQIQYNIEKKEKQIALLTKASQLQHTELQRQNTTRNVSIAVCTLIALLAGITFNRNRIKQKANSEIEKTLHRLKTTQEQLVEREKLAALGKFTADVAKQIEVPLAKINELNRQNQTVMNAIKKQNVIAESTIIEELKNNLQYIYHNGKEADGMVKRVLAETRKLQG